MAALVDVLSAYDVQREQLEVLSVGTGNAPFDIGPFAARGGIFGWLKIIEGAMFLTTDNADAQAGLLIGADKIVRLKPEGEAASLGLDDWKGASKMLPPLALTAFDARRSDIAKFFEERVTPRHRFYT